MSFDAGLALGLMLGNGGSSDTDIIAVVPSDTALTVMTTADRTAEKPEILIDSYSLEVEIITKITTVTTSTSTFYRKWEARWIKSVSGSDGLVYSCTRSPEGELTSITKSNGDNIYITYDFTAEGEGIADSVPDAVALGYMVSFNQKALEELDQAIEGYEDGLEDGTPEGGEVPTVDGDTDIVIPDGSCMVEHWEGNPPMLSERYYGRASGEIEYILEDSISFYCPFSAVEYYDRWGDLIRRDIVDSSVSAQLYYSDPSKWKLTGDWYRRDTGERYEGEGVTPFK